MEKTNLINSKTVFQATLIVIPAVTLIVYLTGLTNNRSLYLNSLISTTIISVIFLTFITVGLYRGWKLKDTLGDFRKKINPDSIPDTSSLNSGISLSDSGELGIVSLLISIGAWLAVGLSILVLLQATGGLIWAVIVLLTGLLYWIVFRAFRLIFKNSPQCKGNLIRSFSIALLYTALYNFWIYLIIIGTHYLNTEYF